MKSEKSREKIKNKNFYSFKPDNYNKNILNNGPSNISKYSFSASKLTMPQLSSSKRNSPDRNKIKDRM